jgi:UDP-N-acetylmuramoyl-tripeptide--D-alanyl-D-alanine ligase
MKPIPLPSVRQIVSGKNLSIMPAIEITGISTDTRTLEEGSLFIAIKGDTHDGHQYLSQAQAAGAAAAIVEQEPAIKIPNLPMVLVKDARKALGKLACHVRRQLSCKVIAVGGSNGKTGTKNLIHAALCKQLHGTISPKSFNNDIGVPLAIFPASANQDYLVLELGTNHPGEIRALTQIALPDIAVITNVAAEHLEGLGDINGVRREEATLIEGLSPNGLLIVNGDDPLLLEAVSLHKGKRITFGLQTHNDLHATHIDSSLTGVRFRLNGRRTFMVPMVGKHVAINALAAIAVARRLGLTEESIAEALACAKGPEMRLELQHVRGLTLLNDAYNANPASMRAALETLVSLTHLGRKVAILGDMRELGDQTDPLHRELGQFAGGLGLDRLFCVGPKAALIAEEALAAGMAPSRISCFPDTPTAERFLPPHLQENDLVLLKGSRYMKLELIAQALDPEAFRKAS